MSTEIDNSKPPGRRFQVILGLCFIGMMAIPFMCHETRGCSLSVVLPWSAMGWSARSGITLFVVAGLSLIFTGLRLRTLAAIAGLGVIVLFAVLINSIVFGLRAPACGPVIGVMRMLAEVPAFRDCALWPTVAALWIDAFFIGFALEILRDKHLPESLRPVLKPWIQGLLLTSLAPLLLLMLLLLIPTIGSAVVKEQWQKWRSR